MDEKKIKKKLIAARKTKYTQRGYWNCGSARKRKSQNKGGLKNSKSGVC